MSTIKVILCGANGTMGKVLTKFIETSLDFEVICGIDIKSLTADSFCVYKNINEIKEIDEITADVIIDFSHSSVLDELLDMAVYKNIPLVIATTGLADYQVENIKKCSLKIPVFFSANMSLGMNYLIELVKQSVLVLGKDFDIEILEKHHNRKIDAPSGSANSIIQAIQSIEQSYYVCNNRFNVLAKRNRNEIGVSAIRGGTIVGQHTVIFAGKHETIEITHNAESREVFAEGALRAAKFIVNQPVGLYGMKDILNLPKLQSI